MNGGDPYWDPAAVACEKALEALVFGAPIDPTDPVAVAHWLDQSGVIGEDRKALCAQLRGQLTLYRELVRERLADALEQMLPRTREVLGSRWQETLQRFYSAQGPQSPILRELLAEFVGWTRTHFALAPAEPIWLVDFILYESLQNEIAALGSVQAGSLPDSMNESTCFVRQPRAILTHFGHAVHAADVTPMTPPAQRETFLLAYCDADYELRWLELSTVAASLWEILAQPIPLVEAVTLALGQNSAEQRGDPLQAISTLLADLSQRGLILVQSSC